MRHLSELALSLLLLTLACGGNDSSSEDVTGAAGTSSAGTAGIPGSGAGSGLAGSAGSSAAGGSESGGASAGGGTSGSGSSVAGSAGSAANLYMPPSAIIGGACEGMPTPESPPCTYAPEQVYCSLEDPNQVIMAVCSASGRSQCEVMSECEPG